MVTGRIIVAVAALALALTLGRRRRLGDHRDWTPSVAVSVIVPARNEATTLPVLLASIAGSSVRPLQVLVVDDGSSDGTASVARSHGATVIEPGPPPAGWNGKPWACAAGADAATGELLVFLDADTWLGPHALAALAGEWGRHGGLVSVQPEHRPVGGVEQLSAVFNLAAVTGSGMFGLIPADRAAAFGPCLVTSASDLAAVGGWSSVRASVIEDVELAQRYRRDDQPVTCLLGSDEVAFRMYRTGRAVVEGWTKNIAAGALAASRWATAATVVWVAAVIATDVRLGRALAAWAGGGSFPAVPLACYLALAAGLWWALRQVGRFRWWVSAAHVIPIACFVAVFARSLWLRLRGRPVRWRGRDVATSRSAP